MKRISTFDIKRAAPVILPTLVVQIAFGLYVLRQCWRSAHCSTLGFRPLAHLLWCIRRCCCPQQAEGTDVAMHPYLGQLLDRVAHASFHDGVVIQRNIEPITLPRETAVAIGLFVNEAIANCAKYAFPNAMAGVVDVTFHEVGKGWTLVVSDNGVGAQHHHQNEQSQQSSGGLGTSLMVAFAQQAGAESDVRLSPGGGSRLSLTCLSAKKE